MLAISQRAGGDRVVPAGIGNAGADKDPVVINLDGAARLGGAGHGQRVVGGDLVGRADARVLADADHPRRGWQGQIQAHGVSRALGGVVARHICGHGAELVATFGQNRCADGPLALGIGKADRDDHAVVVQGHGAVRLGRAADVERAIAGEIISLETTIFAETGDHRRGGSDRVHGDSKRIRGHAHIRVVDGDRGERMTSIEQDACLEGPTAVGIGGDGADFRVAVPDFDSDVRIRGPLQGEHIIEGDFVGRIRAVLAPVGNDRLGRRNGVDGPCAAADRGAFVARRVGGRDGNRINAIGQGVGAGHGVVAIGIAHRCAHRNPVGIEGHQRVGRGGSGDHQGVVAGEAVAGGAGVIADAGDGGARGRHGVDGPCSGRGANRGIARGIGGRDGQRIDPIGQDARGDGVVALRIRHGGAHKDPVGVKLHSAAGFGGARHGQRVVAGELVGRAGAGVLADADDRRRIGGAGVDGHCHRSRGGAGVAGRVGRFGGEVVDTVREGAGRVQRPVPLGIGGRRADQRGAVIDRHGATGFGGTADRKVLVAGHTVTLGACVLAITGDHRRGGGGGVDLPSAQAGGRADVARGVDLVHTEGIAAVGQSRRGDGVVPAGVRHRGPDQNRIVRIGIIIKVHGAAGFGGARHGQRVVAGDLVGRARAGVITHADHAGGGGRGGVDGHRDRVGVDALVARHIGRVRAEAMRPIGKTARRGDGPVPLRVGQNGADGDPVVIDRHQAIGFGRAADDQLGRAGDVIAVA